MIKVTLKNIEDFDLTLDNTDKILARGTSKEVLKRLEKKYGKKSNHMCSKIFDTYEMFANKEYYYISIEDKYKWITNYEVYIRSSFQYKFWIVVYKLITALDY